MRRLLRLSMLFCLIPTIVLASSFSEGEKAFESGNFKKALQHLKPLAEKGNARAQIYIGVLYYNGQGVKESNTAAFKWFQKAAMEGGSAEGQFQLGQMYTFGFGVPADEPNPDGRAIELYTSAASLGHAEAQYNLGLMYLAGNGIEADPDQGMNWIKRAARNGFEEAKKFVGDYE